MDDVTLKEINKKKLERLDFLSIISIKQVHINPKI